MRLQHVSVIFIVVFIPIILVTSYYISLQVNTVRLESSYTEKLLDATYDAMTAFELNTANEDLSTVSDSLRSIIDASTNIFFNTLCTNFGVSNASKTYLQPYVPAILYTLYDGYYIYAPTNVPEICVDKYGNTMRVGDYGVSGTSGNYTFSQDSVSYDEAHNPIGGYQITTPSEDFGQVLYKKKTSPGATPKYSTKIDSNTYFKRDYILKSYIPYSARYESGSIDVTINYTLDNFLTIEGKIGNAYYTKSGYFIDTSSSTGLVQEIKVNGVALTVGPGDDWKRYSEETLNYCIEHPEEYEVTVKIRGNNSGESFIISNKDGAYAASGKPIEYWHDAISALEYYVDSYLFSKWLTSNLGDLTANTLTTTQYSVSDINGSEEIQGNTKLYGNMFHDFGDDTTLKMFSSTNNNPESEESVFYNHKRNVIKNSITYNMILSMIVYTEESRTVEFNMPSFKETEWDRILNNVSITTFMEGMRCGFKWYNNYAIVTSTNNEISVTDNEIYYTPRVIQDTTYQTGGAAKILANIEDDDVNNNPKGILETAHRIDCEELKLGTTNNFNIVGGETVWLGCISFTSKDIKYDKVLDKSGEAKYNHKVYTDYDCIVDSNYTVKDASSKEHDGNYKVLEFLMANSSSTGNSVQKDLWWKLRAYRIAVAKEKNDLYKTTAFQENYGWAIAYKGTVTTGVKKEAGTDTVEVPLGLSSVPTGMNSIKKIEVTIENTRVEDASGNPIYGVYTDTITASFDSGFNPSETYPIGQTVSTTSTSRRTLEFAADIQSIDNYPKLYLKTTNQNTQFTVESVKVYYK